MPHCIFWLAWQGGFKGLLHMWPGVCWGLSGHGQHHTWGRAGILHWLFLLLLCRGMRGAQELCWFLVGQLWGWAGGIRVGPPCTVEEKYSLSWPQWLGQGRDQEEQAKAIDLSCPMSHTGMSPCVWETQDTSYTSGSSRTFLQGRCSRSPLGSCQIEG